jgi:TPR repeat protein
MICCGCVFADAKQNDRDICPFCRAPMHENMANAFQQQLDKWLEVNDPVAFYEIGALYYHGRGVLRDTSKALEYFIRGSELGSADASVVVADAYDIGDGVTKDEKKARHYYELAAMKGDNLSRYNLGCDEANVGEFEADFMRTWT